MGRDLQRRAALPSSGRFDALITGDQGLEFQQNLAALELGVLLLVVPDNRVETITAMAPQVLSTLAELRPGSVVHVAAKQGAAADRLRRAPIDLVACG